MAELSLNEGPRVREEAFSVSEEFSEALSSRVCGVVDPFRTARENESALTQPRLRWNVPCGSLGKRRTPRQNLSNPGASCQIFLF